MSERRFTVDPAADAAYFPIAPSIRDGESVETVIVEREQGTVILDSTRRAECSTSKPSALPRCSHPRRSKTPNRFFLDLQHQRSAQ